MNRNLNAGIVVMGLMGVGLTADRARATSYTFPAFSQVVFNDDLIDGLDPETATLIGAPAGAYNAYSVNIDWSAITGDPYSNEAFWAFADTNDLATASVFYADPGSAPNSGASGASRTLSWSGYMLSSYAGGDPLHMFMGQDYSGSSANWNNISITIMDAARYSTPFSGTTEAMATWNRPSSPSTLSSVGTDVAYSVVPFHVDTTTSYEIESLFPDADGVLCLYEGGFDPADQLTNLVGYMDIGYLGEADFGTADLTAGKQYYLVVTGYENIDFGAFAGTITSGNPLAPGQATLGLVPEPASALLVLGAFSVLVRRRRTA